MLLKNSLAHSLPRRKLCFLFSTATYTKGRTHYQTLGISPEATPQQIKAKFLELAKLHHPDVSKNDQSNKYFSEINAAYDVLKDPETKSKYDYYLYNPTPYTQDAQTESNFKFYEFDEQQYIRNQERRREILHKTFFFLVVCPSIYIYYSNREAPTQDQIRKNNIILANQNINSSPSAIQKRMEMYEEERKQKQFRIVVVDMHINRHNNAYLSKSDLQDPEKKGKSYTTIQKPNTNELETIAGVKKIVYVPVQEVADAEYM